MALPPGIIPKTVMLGPFTNFDGTVCTGRVTIGAPENVLYLPTGAPLVPNDMVQQLKSDGTASFMLCPTDADGLNRKDWTYRLTVEISGASKQLDIRSFPLPSAGPDGIDLDSLVTVPSSAGVPISVDVLSKADFAPSLLAELNNTASATSVALRAAFVATLGASNGTDDTTWLNAALAAGGRFRGRPGQTYLHSGPLVLPSDTELDMTGCTVRLLPGSACNDLINQAANTVRRLLDVVTTASSTTITSATAAFVSGDVGKAITIQGAGTGGVPLTTTIASITNATTAVLATAVPTAVTGQYAAIGTRDKNIRVIGGDWDHQNNTNSTQHWLAHGLRFRHVDGLTVRDLSYRSTAGKYAINPGDCTDVQITGIRFPSTFSDGVHFNGPATRLVIRDIIGDYMGDDLVSFTARDSVPQITDCAGDITDVVVDGALVASVNPTLFTCALKVVAGKTTDGSANYTVRNISARSLTCPSQTAWVAYVGDTSGGVITDIDIDSVHSLGSTNSLYGSVYINNATSIDRINVSRIKSHPTDKYPVLISGVTAGRITLRDITSEISTSGGVVHIDTASTIDTLMVDGVQANAAAGGKAIVLVTNGAPTKQVVKRLVLSRVDFVGTGTNYLIGSQDPAATLTSVEISNVNCAGITYPLGMYGATTDVTATNVRATGMSSWIRAIGSAANVNVYGAAGLKGDNDSFTTDPGSTLSVTARRSSVFTADPDMLATGEETHSRMLAANTGLGGVSGRLWLTYFTARKTETITQVRTLQGGQAAATATLCRIGVYSVASNGDLTLVASTANDTTLWNSTFAAVTKTLTSSWSKVAGQRYAVGLLAVAATAPKWVGASPALGVEAAQTPRLVGNLESQTDLPSTITSGSVANNGGTAVYSALLP